jgi:hypothetical protein
MNFISVSPSLPLRIPSPPTRRAEKSQSIHPSMPHPFNHHPSRTPTTLSPTNTPPPPPFNASQILRLNDNPKFPRQTQFVNSFGPSIGAYFLSGTQPIHLCISPISNGNLFKALIICILQCHKWIVYHGHEWPP